MGSQKDVVGGLQWWGVRERRNFRDERRHLPHCIPGEIEAQGEAGCARITHRGSGNGRVWTWVTWSRRQPVSPAYKACVERDTTTDSVCPCKAAHSPLEALPTTQRTLTVSCCGLAARAGCISDSWLFSVIQYCYQISYFYGPFPFLFLFIFSFILMSLSYWRHISRPGHLITICTMLLYHPFWEGRTCLDLLFIFI